MRKVLWSCLGLAVVAALATFLTCEYVSRNPDSLVGRAVVKVYHVTVTHNPFVRAGREVAKRAADAFPKTPPSAPSAAPAKAEHVAQVRSVCEPVLKEDLPPVQMLGTIIIPDDPEFPGNAVPLTDPPIGYEEMCEIVPMEPLQAAKSAPATMPPAGQPIDEGSTLRVEDLMDYVPSPMQPVPADQPDEVEQTGLRPQDIYDHIYHSQCPHEGCRQPIVCPYTGKCYEPEPAVPHCETDDPNILNELFGPEKKEPATEEPAEPKPMNDNPEMGKPCPQDGCEGYHHGGYRQIVCPYSGKSYPCDPDPCEPAPSKELKVEEAQEPPAPVKPEKKPDAPKKRRVRHKMHLLLESDPTPHTPTDTLEFRPSDMKPNEFDVIPF